MMIRFERFPVVVVAALAACGDSDSYVEPILLAETSDVLSRLVIADSELLVAARPDGGGAIVYAVPKVGGAPRTLYAATEDFGYIDVFGADATSVYWRENNGTVTAVRAASLVGDGTSRVIARGGLASTFAALDETYVYFNVGGSVMRTPKAAPDEGTSIGELDEVVLRSAIVDDAALYVMGDRALWRLPKDGSGAPVELAYAEPVGVSPSESYTPLVADSEHVYWWDRLNAIRRVPKSGAAPAESIAAQTCVTQAALVADRLYWGCHAFEPLRTVATTGGTTTAMPIRHGSPDGVAADDTLLYWTDRDRVLAMPR